MNRNQEVKVAMTNMKSIDPQYYEATLASRTANQRVGSCFFDKITPEQVERFLLNLEWEEYAHKEIAEGCRAFVAFREDCGEMGVVYLNNLFPDTKVSAVNRKGQTEIQIKAPSLNGETTGMVVMICGMEQDKFCMFTVHPGPPIAPETVTCENQELTAGEARDLGFKFAKLS